MRVLVKKIHVKEGRRSLDPIHVQELADSIRELGLLNPPTVDRDNTLIAGLHRLEAVKLMGWTEVECTVSSLEGLQAELAEIDENFVRSDLSVVEYGEMLLRRKEIYEALHPEARHGGDRKSGKIKCAKCTLETAKSFVDDTAEKLKVDPCTVRRQIQTAKNLTPETKEIIKEADTKISRKAALKLSRLEPERQREAAGLLAAQKIRTVDEYMARTEEAGHKSAAQDAPVEQAAYTQREENDVLEHLSLESAEMASLSPAAGSRFDRKKHFGYAGEAGVETVEKTDGVRGILPGPDGQKRDTPVTWGNREAEMDQEESGKLPEPGKKPEMGSLHTFGSEVKGNGASLKEIVAELKDPDKDCSSTPESFLAEYGAFVRKFHREIGWFNNPYYDTVYSALTGEQLARFRELTDSICSVAEEMYHRAV